MIGDVTGSTARKAVKNIRDHNISSGDKAYQSSPVNLARGKVTDKISQSGQLIRKAEPVGTIFHTTKISTQEIVAENETTVLDETTVLEQERVNESGVTTLLTTSASSKNHIFEIEHDITFVHTNEMIV